MLIAATAIACSDDEPMSVEEYLLELARIEREADSAFQQSGQPEISLEGDLEASRESVDAYYDNVADINEQALEDVRDLDPPDEVAALHDQYVEALEALSDLASERDRQIADAASIQELSDVIAGTPEGVAAGERIIAACTELQEVAYEKAPLADLTCNE